MLMNSFDLRCEDVTLIANALKTEVNMQVVLAYLQSSITIDLACMMSLLKTFKLQCYTG